MNGFFSKVSLSVVLLFTGIVLFYSFGIISFELLKSLIIGGFITYLNFALGFLSFSLAFGKSANIFLIVVFGGMVLRLFMMVIMVFISLKFLDIRVGVFIFVILFFYIFYLIIEIFYLFMKKGRI